MSQLDWSLPIATLLREGTAVAHEQVENSQGAVWLTRGQLDREEYIRFLMMLWLIYSTLEAGLDRHAADAALAPVYNPHLLSRSPAIDSDIKHLLETDDWKSTSVFLDLRNSSPSPLTAYIDRLQHLSETSPSLLLAHAYVRYLGDLSGGQVIKRSIANAYNLRDDDGGGTEFYDFGKNGAGMGDLRKIKLWFRDRMNEGVPLDNVVLKESLIKEANIAFSLNGGIFQYLRPPSTYRSRHTHKSSPSTSGILNAPLPPPHSPASTNEKTISVPAVLSMILAASIAHFLLTTSGISGESVLRKIFSLS